MLKYFHKIHRVIKTKKKQKHCDQSLKKNLSLILLFVYMKTFGFSTIIVLLLHLKQIEIRQIGLFRELNIFYLESVLRATFFDLNPFYKIYILI